MGLRRYGALFVLPMRRHFIAAEALLATAAAIGASSLRAEPRPRAAEARYRTVPGEVIVLRGTGRDGAHLSFAVPVNILAQLQQPGSGSNVNLNQIGGAGVSSSLYDAGNTALKVNCVVGCSATGSFTDNSGFTTGSTAVTNISGLFNDSATALTSGNAGALRATTDRMLFVNVGKMGGTAVPSGLVDTGNAAFKVNCVVGCSASAGFADNSAFTAGATAISISGGVFNDGLAAVTSGNAAGARITSSRAVHVNLRNNSGTEIGTGSTPVRVDPTGTTTQPVSGTVTANAGTGTFTVGGAVTANAGTGPFPVAGTIASGSADSGNPVKTGGVFNTTQPTVTNGQRVDTQMTVRGEMLIAKGVSGFSIDNTGFNVTGSLPAGTNNIGDVDIATFPDNEPFNLAQVGGTATVTGGVNGSVGVGGVTANGSASTGNPVFVGGIAGGNRQQLILCDSSAVISTASSGSAQLVALTSGQTTYVCSYNWMANGTVNVKLVYGTGTNCGTGSTDLTGAYNHTTQTGIAVTSPSWTGIKTAASNALCINLSAAVQVSGVVMYTKF